MKNIYKLKYLISIILSILLIACSSDDPDEIIPNPPNPKPNPKVTITVNPSNIILPAIGGEQTFSVTTDATNWTVTSSEDWLKVAKLGSDKVTVKSETNTGSVRSAIVECTIDGEKISASVNVSQSVITTTQSDSLALVDICKSLNGVNWTTKWDLTSDMSKWKGVEIADGQVVRLDLSANNITGNISSSIKNLTKLQYLDLSGNKLSGTIPVEISDLTELKYLDLSENNLSGVVPPLNSRQLVVLDLSSNALTTLPSLPQSLPDLEYLAFNNNKLSGSLPTSWSAYRKLIYIDVSQNSFEGIIPDRWSTLTKMKAFHLYNNILSGSIPAYVQGFVNLKSLALNRNNLTGTIPANLGQLPQLEILWLSQNRLTGEIPPSLTGNVHWGKWRDNVISQQNGYGFTNSKAGFVRSVKTTNSQLVDFGKQIKEVYKQQY